LAFSLIIKLVSAPSVRRIAKLNFLEENYERALKPIASNPDLGQWSVSGGLIGYFQTNLASDIDLLAANTDPNLKNPWGMSFGLNPLLGSPIR